MNTPLKSLLVGLALLALLPLQSNAQAWVEASAGTSMAETVVTKFNVGVPLSERWQILGGYRYGQNRYTFIDARPITDGDAMQASLGASVRLSQHGPLQLHAFALAGYRRIEDDGETVEQTAQFLTVEPGLVASLALTDKLSVQTGVNFWIHQQIRPSLLGDQIQNGVLQLGATYAITDRLRASLYLPTGPTFGGDGDTHKFHWEARLGLRYSLSASTASTFSLLFP